MKITAKQKIFDGERSYAPETVIEWPADRPLPLDVGVGPATAADAAAVYGALEKQHSKRVAEQEKFLKRPGLPAAQAEMAHAALNRYRDELADVINKAGRRPAKEDPNAKRGTQASPDPVTGNQHPQVPNPTEGRVNDPLS